MNAKEAAVEIGDWLLDHAIKDGEDVLPLIEQCVDDALEAVAVKVDKVSHIDEDYLREERLYGVGRQREYECGRVDGCKEAATIIREMKGNG